MHKYLCFVLVIVAVVSMVLLNLSGAYAQTASTGMVLGEIRDVNRSSVVGATIQLTQVETGTQRTTQSEGEGRYSFPLLPPGRYDMEIVMTGFSTLNQTGIQVRVNERSTVNGVLEVGSVTGTVTIQAQTEVVDSSSSTLGRVIEEQQVVNLPLATRNYTQILALSPGVISNVADAGALGRNSLELSAQGARFSDNNVQVNGADANNVFTTNLSDGAGGQGIAVPAPDSIKEFKVQTALYDASTGRNGGANVNVVTKSGTNEFHGNVYHFFRNEALNANDFFRNRAGLSKPILRQNQFGFTLGGPIRKDTTFFFVSYEGNRQYNGVTGGGRAVAFLPPLTNDRSAAELGRIFGGQRGQFGGVPIAANGSNINPVALAILNKRLPSGDFLIPNPQVILPSGIGQSNFSVPADYNEDQMNINIDQRLGARDRLSGKYFFAAIKTALPFGGGANVPGFPSLNDGRNHNLAVTWTRILKPTMLNEFRGAFTRLQALGTSEEPVSAAEVGIKTPVSVSGLPNIGFLTFNLTFGASLPPLGSKVDNYQISDLLTYTRGRQNMRMGAEYKKVLNDVIFDFDDRAILRFITIPDFLLGLPFPANGHGANAPFSNVFISSARAGLIGRAQRMSDFGVFFQDDIKVNSRLQLNLGLRYDVYGQVSDALGRLANFDISRATPIPPPQGTLSGFVVARKSLGTDPPEVVRLDSDNIIANDYNNFAPRFGFAYRLLKNKAFVLRGGYGAYFSRPGTVTLFQSGPNLPFAVISTLNGFPNRNSSFQDPFDPTLPAPEAFPVYQPRFATSTLFVNAMDPKMRAPTVHQWGLNTQYGFLKDYLLEVGYVGTRGAALVGRYRFNQPLLASVGSPVNGETTNTVQNARLRAPIQGVDPSSSLLHTNAFDSSYHSLQASLIRRFSRSFQFMASYTWSHSIDNLTFGDLQAVGGFEGDASNLDLNRASSDFDRRHRFVANYYWQLPQVAKTSCWSKLLNGWALSGIGTFQTGRPFSILDTAAATVFAVTTSRAQFAPGASAATIQLNGRVQDRLNRYFNTGGFAAAPAIGNGLGFGNSGRNILVGPGQRNVDIAIVKRTRIGWPSDAANLEFRTELFNAFNFVNFGQPGINRASAQTFGVISNTTVAPRIIQFALKFNF